MPEIQRVLAQSSPAAGVLTDAYTCATTGAVISSVVICSRSPSVVAFVRISVAVGGAADDPSQYVYYDLPMPPNDTFIATVGISLRTGDIIRVYSDQAVISFNIFGVEIT